MSAERFPHLPLLPLVIVDQGSAQLRHQVFTDQLDCGNRLLRRGQRRNLQLVVEAVDVGQFLHQQLRVNCRFLIRLCNRAEREPTSSSSVLISS